MSRGKHASRSQRGEENPAVPYRIVALVPAHNEEESIGNTIRSLLNQDRPLDAIIVVSDNSTDNTVAIARTFPVIVIESENRDHCPACEKAGKNTHRKAGALNQAWGDYAQDADIVVCADADATFPRHAVAHWEREFARNPNLGGSSSQPVLIGGEHWEMRPYTGSRWHVFHWINDRVHAFFAALLAWYLPRLQRFEFAKCITQNLNRGFVFVVSGVGCAFRNQALKDVARQPNKHKIYAGPWTYESVVEDYHLTYQMRRAGWKCKMSRTVWCYAGSMITLKSLWYQRIKWTGGTNGDLMTFGFDRLNYRQWFQNVFLMMNIFFWVVWLSLEVPQLTTTGFKINWWWQAAGVFFGILELIHMAKLNHPRWRRDWKDWFLAGFMIHLTVLTVLSLAWGAASWGKVLYSTLGDLWAPQYRAEGMKQVEEHEIGVS